jgi:hypothetical protein
MARLVQAATLTVASGALILAGAGGAVADSSAKGAAIGSPGVLSGNVVQVPVHAPINFCGNTLNFVAALNPTFGNVCVNDDGHKKRHHKDKDHHGKRHHGKR